MGWAEECEMSWEIRIYVYIYTPPCMKKIPSGAAVAAQKSSSSTSPDDLVLVGIGGGSNREGICIPQHLTLKVERKKY